MQPKKIHTSAKKCRVSPRARSVPVRDFRFYISIVYCMYWRLMALAMPPSCCLILLSWLKRISLVAYRQRK